MTDYLYETYWLVPNWKWFTLLAAFIVLPVLRPVLKSLLRFIKETLKKRTESESFESQALELPIEKPISWILLTFILIAIISSLHLPEKMEDKVHFIAKVFLTLHFIRFFYHLVEALGLVFKKYALKTPSTLDDQLVPFATKTLKVLVIVLGCLIALQNFGFNVVGLLAGLGLGGLALALAAQDTAANVFGSITILLDQPFSVGDYIKVGDSEGTVEEIGFRSTRIRTFYNSLISIPNSTIAKEKVDNMQLRPRRRIRQILGLTYETSPEKISTFCSQLKFLLKSHQQVDQDVLVAFNHFNSSSLDVLMQFHLLRVQDAETENELIQNIFLQILELARQLEIDFAYQTQTLHLIDKKTP